MIALVMTRYHDARARLGQWLRAEGKRLEEHATGQAAKWRTRLSKAVRRAEGGYRKRGPARKAEREGPR